LSSSWTIVLAMRALRADATGRFARWWLVTFLLGGTFLVLTAREWALLIGHDRLTIASNLFRTTFFTLVALHALHGTVVITLIGLVRVLRLRGYVDVRHAERTEMLSW